MINSNKSSYEDDFWSIQFCKAKSVSIEIPVLLLVYLCIFFCRFPRTRLELRMDGWEER